MRLLVIDDVESVRESVKEALKDAGFSDVETSPAGDEAFDLIEKERDGFDIIVLDQQDDEGDRHFGLHFLSEIKRDGHRWSEAAVIMLTVENKSREVAKLLESGAAAWICKSEEYEPIDLLVARVKLEVANKQIAELKEVFEKCRRQPIHIGPEVFQHSEIVSGDGRVFIGNPFSNEFEDVVSCVKKAVERHKLEVVVGNKDALQGKQLFREIAKNIQECEFAIFDITDAKPNVMFECGLASGLSKEILFIIEDEQEVPSDLKGVIVARYSRGNLKSLEDKVERFIKDSQK